MPETPIVAAIAPNDDGRIDDLVSELANTLSHQGWRVRGLLQQRYSQGGFCRYALTDIESGETYPISQNLGAHSQSCAIDPQAMADASGVLRRIADEGADLAVVNRFGKQEAGGRGFSAEMLEIMSRGIPLLTVVANDCLAAWREFTGGIAAELPGTREAIEGWLHSRVRPASSRRTLAAIAPETAAGTPEK